MTISGNSARPLAESAVVDPFALYRIVEAHTPDAAAIRSAALNGALKLFSPVVAIAVAGSMRSCWDDECRQRHAFLGSKLSAFCERAGLEIGAADPEAAVTAGRLYAASTTMRIEGPEVLAACHAAQVASERDIELLTVSRAAYCYRAIHSAGIQVAMRTL
ncbi:hypothetical protein LUW75_02780 [Streptomyces sp. MRC013]|uniref:hypothetical protein n=1 Tax=Streptomyces sp. MRC013 TaxID=2898276 RepID=UPI002025C8AF|nr:hypothetical protein [Streptomyces sp. MRC013]URM89112.1 hypothetical protein LUW75_02780 [Streptomyces sp. MRC013]